MGSLGAPQNGRWQVGPQAKAPMLLPSSLARLALAMAHQIIDPVSTGLVFGSRHRGITRRCACTSFHVFSFDVIGLSTNKPDNAPRLPGWCCLVGFGQTASNDMEHFNDCATLSQRRQADPIATNTVVSFPSMLSRQLRVCPLELDRSMTTSCIGPSDPRSSTRAESWIRPDQT